MISRNRLLLTSILATGISLLVAASVEGTELFSGSLKNGDYGGGQTIDTQDPDHGASPHMLGIVDGPDGVTFTPTETDGRSNAVIYWQPGTNRTSFLQHGTVTMSIFVDRDVLSAMAAGGALWSDNYGWSAFRHGQASIAANVYHDVASNQAKLTWAVLDSGAWHHLPVGDRPALEYQQWNDIGYTWGGPAQDYEIWVNGQLAAAFTPPAALPWGAGGAATNVGLGDLHERGYNVYGSASGVTFQSLHIWNEYVPRGGTVAASDFDGDGDLDGSDVDALVAAIAVNSQDLLFDLTGDGSVDTADLDRWLVDAGATNLPSGNAYLHGDADLSGSVDVLDFNLWNSNKFTSDPAWTSGDFSADGVVDVLDLNVWNENKFTTADGLAAVPEPSWIAVLISVLFSAYVFGPRH